MQAVAIPKLYYRENQALPTRLTRNTKSVLSLSPVNSAHHEFIFADFVGEHFAPFPTAVFFAFGSIGQILGPDAPIDTFAGLDTHRRAGSGCISHHRRASPEFQRRMRCALAPPALTTCISHCPCPNLQRRASLASQTVLISCPNSAFSSIAPSLPQRSFFHLDHQGIVYNHSGYWIPAKVDGNSADRYRFSRSLQCRRGSNG